MQGFRREERENPVNAPIPYASTYKMPKERPTPCEEDYQAFSNECMTPPHSEKIVPIDREI
jgi:hypothetical protein